MTEFSQKYNISVGDQDSSPHIGPSYYLSLSSAAISPLYIIPPGVPLLRLSLLCMTRRFPSLTMPRHTAWWRQSRTRASRSRPNSNISPNSYKLTFWLYVAKRTSDSCVHDTTHTGRVSISPMAFVHSVMHTDDDGPHIATNVMIIR